MPAWPLSGSGGYGMRVILLPAPPVEAGVLACWSERWRVGDSVACEASVGAVEVDFAGADVGADEHSTREQSMTVRAVCRRRFNPALRDPAQAVVVARRASRN